MQDLVSIITVVLNGEKIVESTLLSVSGQSYGNIEHIVMDGGSTDGTLDIIRKHQSSILHWESARDNGIYDAMNRGVARSNGRWIIFINAGDTFADRDVVAEIMGSVDRGAELLYGDYVYKYSDVVSRLVKPKPLDQLWKYMSICHQALFVRSDIMRKYLFNIKNLAADHEMIYRCFIDGRKFQYSGIAIAHYLGGGVSQKKNVRSVIHRWKAVRRLTPSLRIDLFYFFFTLKQLARSVVRWMLPDSVVMSIVRVKNSLARSG